MPLAFPADDAECPSCGSMDAMMFEKQEATITKEHYTCDDCGCEWTERRKGGLDG